MYKCIEKEDTFVKYKFSCTSVKMSMKRKSSSSLQLSSVLVRILILCNMYGSVCVCVCKELKEEMRKFGFVYEQGKRNVKMAYNLENWGVTVLGR